MFPFGTIMRLMPEVMCPRTFGSDAGSEMHPCRLIPPCPIASWMAVQNMILHNDSIGGAVSGHMRNQTGFIYHETRSLTMPGNKLRFRIVPSSELGRILSHEEKMEIHRLEAPGVSSEEGIEVRDRMARFFVEEYGIPEGAASIHAYTPIRMSRDDTAAVLKVHPDDLLCIESMIDRARLSAPAKSVMRDPGLFVDPPEPRI